MADNNNYVYRKPIDRRRAARELKAQVFQAATQRDEDNAVRQVFNEEVRMIRSIAADKIALVNEDYRRKMLHGHGNYNGFKKRLDDEKLNKIREINDNKYEQILAKEFEYGMRPVGRPPVVPEEVKVAAQAAAQAAQAAQAAAVPVAVAVPVAARMVNPALVRTMVRPPANQAPIINLVDDAETVDESADEVDAVPAQVVNRPNIATLNGTAVPPPLPTHAPVLQQVSRPSSPSPTVPYEPEGKEEKEHKGEHINAVQMVSQFNGFMNDIKRQDVDFKSMVEVMIAKKLEEFMASADKSSVPSSSQSVGSPSRAKRSSSELAPSSSHAPHAKRAASDVVMRHAEASSSSSSSPSKMQSLRSLDAPKQPLSPSQQLMGMNDLFVDYSDNNKN